MATKPPDKSKTDKKPAKPAKAAPAATRPASAAAKRPVTPTKPTPAPQKSAPAAKRPATAEVRRPATAEAKRPATAEVRRPSSTDTKRPSTPAKQAAKADAKAPRCPFSADELGKWRLSLIAKRTELTEDISSLEKDAMEAEDGHTTPQHSAERGSDADIQDVSLSLAGQDKELLWMIDRAIRKIDLADPIPFGVCEYTKTPIARGRLENMPWTPLSIEGATHLEREGLTLEDLLVEG
jgi:RNA polymerase-binding transcription factor DksA